ncbi:MAG: hypothetical protein GF311_06830 [Candidatus Lokiarchaeota archaeon]|nr:hypothetical protein [Candidatus Lokiarchaeota archaeon]
MNLEKFKKYYWIISFLSVAFLILGLALPAFFGTRQFDGDPFLIWIHNLILDIEDDILFSVGGEGLEGTYNTMYFMGFFLTILISIFSTLYIIIGWIAKKKDLGRTNYAWVIGGLLITLLSIAYWITGSIALTEEFITSAIPIGIIFVLMGGIIPLMIGIISILNER